MNLYLLHFDGVAEYVEARSFAEAIELWRGVKRVEWGEDFQPEDEPESCSLVHDRPVIRAGSLAAKLAAESEEDMDMAVEVCGRETDHALVPGTGFCRCTHAMFDEDHLAKDAALAALDKAGEEG